jgi:prepilin-type N-terminal cleavage/methylation domain-containing protein
MTRWRTRVRDEDGMTLIELLVSMMLMAVVSTLVVGAVTSASRVLTRNDDENRGLMDAKVILDRLGRDVRESRGVVCDHGLADPSDPSTSDPACASHLQLWVDSNSDYAKTQDEIITWRLQRSVDGEHYDVWRVVGPEAAPLDKKRVATSLWTAFAFQYDNATFPPGSPNEMRAQEVRITLTYDAIVGRGTDLRQAAFTARLRNKGEK